MRYNPYARRRRLNSAVAPVRRYTGNAVDKEWEIFRNDMLSWADDEEAEAVRQACDDLGISYRDANETVWFVYFDCPNKTEFIRRYFTEQGYQTYMDFVEPEDKDAIMALFDWNKVAKWQDGFDFYTLPGTNTMVGWFI